MRCDQTDTIELDDVVYVRRPFSLYAGRTSPAQH